MQVEQIAREALNEVRQAIGGYRAASLAEEFARAKETLETGVSAECEVEAGASSQRLAAAQESLLALVVREAVTNVIRHAGASRCRLSLANAMSGWRLLIVDDGRAGRGKRVTACAECASGWRRREAAWRVKASAGRS